MDAEHARCVLETLSHSFTNRDNMRVVWGSSPSTDFTRIILNDGPEIISGIECSEGESWLGKKASLAHESAHLIFTDKNVWVDFCEKGRLFQTALNVVEDARIERCMSNLFPGTLRWFRFQEEYIFLNRDWAKMKASNRALMALCAYGLVGRVPEEYLGEKELEFVLECAPLIDEGRTAETTLAASTIVGGIVTSFKKHFDDDPDVKPPDTLGTDEPQKSPKGKLDPRRKPSLPKPKEKPVEKAEASSCETDSEKPEDDKKKPRKSKKHEDGSEDRDGEDKDTESSPPEEPVDDDSSDGDPESVEDADGVTSKGTETCEEGAGSNDGEGSDTGESEKGNSDGGRDSCEDLSGDFSGEDSSEDDSAGEPGGTEGEPEGGIEGDSKGDSPGGTSGGSEGTPGGGHGNPGGDPSPEDASDDSSVESGDPGEPAGDKLDDGELLSGLDSIIEESEEETRAFRSPTPEPTGPEITKEDIGSAVSIKMHHNRQFEFRELAPDPIRRERMEQRLRSMAHRTAEEVRKILEGRHQTPRRNLQKGRLDPSSLWKTSFRDPGVFLRRDQPSQSADLAVYLLVDASGSMRSFDCGRDGKPLDKSRITYAAEAGMLLHMVCKVLNIPHASAAFTTDRWQTRPPEPVIHYRVKTYCERDARFERLSSNDWTGSLAQNIDGYSIRAAAEEVALRPEKSKVMFVISDGDPAGHGYGGAEAINDTVTAVRETEKKGIGVIGIHIGPENSVSTAKMIYQNIIILNSGDLPPVFARTLKRVITESYI